MLGGAGGGNGGELGHDGRVLALAIVAPRTWSWRMVNDSTNYHEICCFNALVHGHQYGPEQCVPKYGCDGNDCFYVGA